MPRHSRPPARRGFSLVELLIVVAIILALAAISSTIMWRAVVNANEAVAVAALRTIHNAETIYSNTYGGGYAVQLTHLGPPASGKPNAYGADLISAELAAGRTRGYQFTYSAVSSVPGMNSPVPPVVFTVRAQPWNPGFSGNFFYYLDETAVIRAQWRAPATATSPPL
jgi:prepilin-type N-terminal cleavage/methylation domain-containing protein